MGNGNRSNQNKELLAERKVYEDLDKSSNLSGYLIDRDIPRLSHCLDQQARLRRVLVGYLNYDSSAEYSCHILSILLAVDSIGCEEMVFERFARLMKIWQKEMKNNYFVGYVQELERLLGKQEPEIVSHLNWNNISLELFTVCPFMTFFTYKCSKSLSDLCLNKVLQEGPGCLPGIMLKVLIKGKETVLSKAGDELLTFLINDLLLLP